MPRAIPPFSAVFFMFHNTECDPESLTAFYLLVSPCGPATLQKGSIQSKHIRSCFPHDNLSICPGRLFHNPTWIPRSRFEGGQVPWLSSRSTSKSPKPVPRTEDGTRCAMGGSVFAGTCQLTQRVSDQPNVPRYQKLVQVRSLVRIQIHPSTLDGGNISRYLPS